jgi:thiamine-monophosphate kinase
MLDLSDGLALDLARMARASGAGALVEAERVPVSAAARRLARRTGKRALEHALSDGEDYELLFAVDPATAGDPAAADCIERRWGLPTRLSRIGRMTRAREGLVMIEDGRARRLEPSGYRHL